MPKHLAGRDLGTHGPGMAGQRGETEEHRELKRLALVWAQAHGFHACATEVRLPRTGFRADVAGFAGASRLTGGETVVFECKQARSDLLRDSAPEGETSSRLREVLMRRRAMEEMLGLHLPSLRRGESLFPECDAYDLEQIQHSGLRRLRREEAQLQAKLFGGTKFDRMQRYGCADRLYLVVKPGVMEPHEAPAGWGVLVQDGGALSLIRRPERIDSGAPARQAILYAISLAATRLVNKAAGATLEEIQVQRAALAPSSVAGR